MKTYKTSMNAGSEPEMRVLPEIELQRNVRIDHMARRRSRSMRSSVPWWKKMVGWWKGEPKELLSTRKYAVAAGGNGNGNGRQGFKPKSKFAAIFQKDWSWWLSRMAIVGFVCVILGAIGVAGLFAYYSRGLPDPNQVLRREGYATKILDREGNTLYDVFQEEKRVPVSIDQIPQSLKLATISIEDKDFYNHPGFDVTGMVRGFSRLFTRGRAQGGSTLTQQLVKNVLLTSDRSLSRKVREFVLSVQIERKFDKDQILQMYLNEAPYGGTAWGVGAAAEQYFGKSVKDLTLVESAILAGLPQRPTGYSPYGSDPEAYKARTQHVLRRMFEDGYITEAERTEAEQQLGEITFQGEDSGFKAPHFVMYVRELLEERYGTSTLERGGLRVTTSLDLELQEKAQAIVAEEIGKVKDFNISNGASIVMDTKTGEILAMVGSRGYNDEEIDGQVNVTTRLRQPGSTIKPLTYVAGFREGYTPATMLMDVETEFPGGVGNPPYTPVNYDGTYRGPVMVREALASSLNIPAVKMLALVGVEDMLSLGYEMGFGTLEPTKANLSRFGLSVTLGGGEVRLIDLASSYAAFANGGSKIEPVAILRVEDNDGRVLDEYNPVKGAQVLSEEEAWLISDILSDNQARLLTFGPNSALNVAGRKVAAKTGTTNDKRDNWTIGWTPSVIAGVWVGNNDNSEMKSVASGVTGAAPIWRSILLEAVAGTDPEEFKRPDGIVELEVDRISGYPAHHNFASKKEFFIKGTEPTGEDPIHSMVKVCPGQDDRLATKVMESLGKYEEKEYYVFKEEDPFAAPGEQNKWQEGILNWIQANHADDPLYHPPSEYCEDGEDMFLFVVEPQDKKQYDNQEITLKADPKSVNKIEQVDFYVDGNLVSSLTDQPWEDKVKLDKGTHTVRMKARDSENRTIESEVKFGVQVPWDWSPSPTPSPTKAVSPTATPTPTGILNLLTPTVEATPTP